MFQGAELQYFAEIGEVHWVRMREGEKIGQFRVSIFREMSIDKHRSQAAVLQGPCVPACRIA